MRTDVLHFHRPLRGVRLVASGRNGAAQPPDGCPLGNHQAEADEPISSSGQREAERLLREERAQQAERDTERERRFAAELAAAREDAFARGQAEASTLFTQQLMDQRQEVVQLAEGVLQQLTRQEEALAGQLRGWVPGLVMNIVRRVLAGAEPDPARVSRLVEQAIAEASPDSASRLEVILHPADLKRLEGMAEDAFRSRFPQIVFRADDALQPNDCLVRGRFGLIDARMETKLRAVESLLAAS